MRTWITLERGEAIPPVHELIPSQAVLLGRHANNTIVLNDEHAARYHALILSEMDRWVVCDVANPGQRTRVNGKPICQPTELLPGDEVTIGRTHLRFTAQTAPAGTLPTQRGTDPLVGNSAEMQKLRRLIGRVAPRSSTVLIQGESGVGKELVARALHRQSPRGAGPFVVVNCAAIAPLLLEAELFGHCKGAFTGADRDRAGLFQQADGGTLVLDEIGEMPLECQPKLLRVIEGQGFRPVGGAGEVHVNVRIIAATNRELGDEAARGKFRRDLLFRLEVIQVRIAPLRTHLEDVPALVDCFLQRLGRQSGRPPIKLTEAALGRLQSCSWPGNVRQLFAVLENAVALCDGPTLDANDLAVPDAAAWSKPDTPLNLAALEAWAIREALAQTQGNVTRAARMLGVVRDTLASKIKKWKIDRHRL